MEEEEQDLATTVLTCEGDIRDPTFPFKLKCLVCKLKRLISDEEKPFQITKVEPWNSVRVTFNIPREAAQRLRQLAELGDRVLRDLGILSVQVEGDQVITLTLAGQYNEPQEIVLRKTPETSSVDNRGNLGTRSFELTGTEAVSAPKTVEGNPKNIVQFLNQQTGLASASTSTSSSPASTSAAVANVTAVVESLLGGQGSSQLANRDVGFRSPNVVAPTSNEPIPYLAATSAGSSRLPQNNPTRSQAAFGPFPFASMTHAMNTKHGAAHHQPMFHVQGSSGFPYTSRSQPFPTSTSRSATITQATSASSSTLTSPATISSPQVAVSSIKQRSSQGTTSNPVFNNFVTHVSSSNMLMAVGTTTSTTAATTSRANVALSSPLLVNLLQSDAHTNKMMPPPAPSANQLPKRKRKPRRPKDKSTDINIARGSSPTVTNIYSSLSSPPLHSSAPSSTCLHPVPNVSSPSFDPLGVLSSQTFNVSLPNIPNIPLSPPMNQITGIHPQIQGQPQVHTGNLQLRTRTPFGTPSLARLPSSHHSIGGVMTPPISKSVLGVTTVVSTPTFGVTTAVNTLALGVTMAVSSSNRNESSLNKEVEKSQANLPSQQTLPSPPPPPPPPPTTATDGKIKHLINPFTGQMEAMPSDEEEDESIGSLPPFPDFEVDTPENGQSERSLSDSGKDNPSDTDSGISKSHTDVSQSSTDWASAESNKEIEIRCDYVKSTNEELRQESASASTGEKLKLRLKLDPKAMRDFIDVDNREKKSRSENVGTCQSSHRVDVSVGNLSAIKKTMSGNLSGGTEPRVPPLHISLRGPNAAVVVSPRKDMGIKDVYDPYSLDSMKTVSIPQKKSRSPRSLRPSSGDLSSMCSSSSHSPKGSDSRRSPRSDNTKNFAREKEDSSSMEEFWNKNVKTLSGGGIVQMPEGESVSPISGMETILRSNVHVSTKEKPCEEVPIPSANTGNVCTSQVTTITPTVTTVALPVSTLPESSSSNISSSPSISLTFSELNTPEKRLMVRTSETMSIISNRTTFHSSNVRKQDSHSNSNNAATSRIFAAISSIASSARTQSLPDRTCIVPSVSQNSEFLQPSLQSNRAEDSHVSTHQIEEPVKQLPDSTTQDNPSCSHLPQVSTSDQLKLPCSVQDRTAISFHNVCNKEQTDRTSLPTSATPPLSKKTNSAISENSPLGQESMSDISVVSSIRKETDQNKSDSFVNCSVDSDSSRAANKTCEDSARLSANAEISTNLPSEQQQINNNNNTSPEQSTIVSSPLTGKVGDLAVAQKKNTYFHTEIEKQHLPDSFSENRTEKKELITTCNKSESLQNTYATSSNNLISQNEEFQSKSPDIENAKFLDGEKLAQHQNEDSSLKNLVKKTSNLIHANHTGETIINRTEIISNHTEKLPKGCEFGFTTLHHDGDTANRISLNIDNEHVPENLCLIDMRKKSSSPVAKIISVDSFPIQSVPKVIEVPSIHISQAVPKSATRLGLPGEVSSIPSLIPSHGDEFSRNIVTIHQNTNDECYLSESTLEESSTSVVHTRLLPITAYSTGMTGNRISHIEKSEAVHINHMCRKVDSVMHNPTNKMEIDNKRTDINEKQSDGSSEESSLDSVEELHETDKDNSNSTSVIKRETDQSVSSENVCSGLPSLKTSCQKEGDKIEKAAIENECNSLAIHRLSTDSNQLKNELEICKQVSCHLNERNGNMMETMALDKEQKNSDSACTAEVHENDDEKTPENSRQKNDAVEVNSSDISATDHTLLQDDSKILIGSSINSKETSTTESGQKSIATTATTHASLGDFTVSCSISEQSSAPESDSSHQELVSNLISSSTVTSLDKEDSHDLVTNETVSEKEETETSSIIHPSTSSTENKPTDVVCGENLSNVKEAVSTVTTIMPSALNLTSSTTGVTSLLSSSKCVSISSDNLASSKVTLIFKGNISSSGSISQNPSSPSVVLPLSSSKTVPIKLVTLPGGHSGLSVRSTSNPAVVEIIGSTAGSSHTAASSNASSSSSPVRLVVSKVSPVKTSVPVLAPSGTSSVRNMATVVVKSVVVTGTSSSIKIVPAKGAICPTTTAASTTTSVSTTGALVLATSPSVSTQLNTSLGTFETVKPVTSVSMQSINPTIAEHISVTDSKEQIEGNEKTDKSENVTETESVNSINSENVEETQTNLSLSRFSNSNFEKNDTADSSATNTCVMVPDTLSLPEDLSKNSSSCDLPELLPVLTEEPVNCRTSGKADNDEILLNQRKLENMEDSEIYGASTDEQLSMPPTLEPSRGIEPTMPELSEISQILSDGNDDDSVTEHSEDSANSESVIAESDAFAHKDGEKEKHTEPVCSLSIDSQSNIIVTREAETVEETIRPFPLSNEQGEQDSNETADSASTENSGGKSTLKEMSQTDLCTSLVYSKPTKRKCSENAAELIKACMGVEDNPKRTCGAKQKSADGFASDDREDDLDERGELEQNSYKTFRSKREERKGRSQRSSSEDEMTLSELASKSRAKTRPNGEDHAIITPVRMRNSNSKDAEEIKTESGSVRSGGRRSSSNESRKSDDSKGRPCYRDGRRDGKKNAQEGTAKKILERNKKSAIKGIQQNQKTTNEKKAKMKTQERRSPTRSGVQRGIRGQEQEPKALCGQSANKDEIDTTTAKRKTRGSGEHQESVPAKRRRCSKDSHR